MPHIGAQRCHDPLLNGKERKPILLINPVGITHCDAHLSDTAQAFLDQSLMPLVKRLIATDEQGRRPLRIKRGPQARYRSFGPIFWRPFGTDSEIKPHGWNKHAIGIIESASINAIDPDRKRLTKRCPRFIGRTNKIGNRRTPGLHNPITHPSHPPRVLDAMPVTESEIRRQIGAHRVGIEYNRAEQGSQRVGEGRLSGARQSHDEYFPVHHSTIPCRQKRTSHSFDTYKHRCAFATNLAN